MVGPDRSLCGGIVSVVNGYLDAGLPEKCSKFDYLSTGVGSNTGAKCVAFFKSLVRFASSIDSYDIVHLHMGPRGSYQRKSIMARIAKRRGKKVVLHEHSGEFARDFEAASEPQRRNMRRTFGIADLVVVLSEEWRDYFAENVCDGSRIRVLHNGVEVPPLACDPCSHQDVLFLGRLDANKSPDVLLRASGKVLREHPGMRLVFGGDGYPERYQSIAEELGIAERCEFLGWVSGAEKERLFSRAGIYCLPSKHEGMPMSVLEAMAHGIPVISTGVGGVPQIIEDGVGGLLMEVDDEEGLSELLARLAGSPSLRGEIGAAGRRVVEERFSVGTAIDRLVCMYEELCGKDGR